MNSSGRGMGILDEIYPLSENRGPLPLLTENDVVCSAARCRAALLRAQRVSTLVGRLLLGVARGEAPLPCLRIERYFLASQT